MSRLEDLYGYSPRLRAGSDAHPGCSLRMSRLEDLYGYSPRLRAGSDAHPARSLRMSRLEDLYGYSPRLRAGSDAYPGSSPVASSRSAIVFSPRSLLALSRLAIK